MTQQKYYNFLNQDDGYVSGLKDKYDLPFSDNSYFVSGFLVNKHLSDEEVENNLRRGSLIGPVGITARKSLYFFGENVLEDHEPKTNESGQLIEQGCFIITLAGPGYNNINNHSKFEGIWEKPTIKDKLEIKSDFTWKRSKEIDQDFFLEWNGTYSFSGDLLVFSLSGQSYSGKAFSGSNENYIPYYGLMYGPIVNSRVAEFGDKVVLNTFLDDSFSDLTNTYKISGATVGMIPDSKKSTHNPGGRGELSKYFIYTDNLQSDVLYDVGSWENNTNTKMEITGFSGLEAVSGIFNDFPPYNNYFGGIGGNVIQNSLDLYEKNEPENGYANIKYSTPEAFRDLKITTDGIEVLADKSATISGSVGDAINKMLVQHETDIYYRIIDRSQELDLEKSMLNGRPLSGYNIKYEDPKSVYDEKLDSRKISSQEYNKLLEDLYIVELDNHRRKMSFMTPFRSNKEKPDALKTIELDLKTTNRKFYFVIARDNQIDTVKIDGKIFDIDDQDKDGIHRKYKQRDNDGNIMLDKEGNPIYKTPEFHADRQYEIEVKFKNEATALAKEIISGYLNDCVDDISKSNNFIQTINLTMPKRDVLLFLKAEPLYTLTISKNNNSHIKSITTNQPTTASKDDQFPIIERHFWGDPIELTVEFDGDKQKFYMINKDFMVSQYSTIIVKRRDGKNTLENTKIDLYDSDSPYYPDGYGDEYKDGFNKNIQNVEFFMPGNDLFLFFDETTILRNLTIKTDPYQFKVEDKPNSKIKEVRIEEQTGKEEQFDEDDNLILFTTLTDESKITLVYGETVDIYVRFESYREKLDLLNLYGQIIPLDFKEPGDFNDDNLPDFMDDKYLWQWFQIKMPTNDTTLFLKWAERYFMFIADYSLPSIVKSAYITINGNKIEFTGSQKVFMDDEIKLEITLADSFSVNYEYSKHEPCDGEHFGGEHFDGEHFEEKDYFTYDYNKEEQTIIITANIKNSDIYFYFDFDFQEHGVLSITECESGSFILKKGKYRIAISGGDGGKSYKIAGEVGRACFFDVELTDDIYTLNYDIGERGGDGGPRTGANNFTNQAQHGGGGGGGASLLYFDKEVKLESFQLIKWVVGDLINVIDDEEIKDDEIEDDEENEYDPDIYMPYSSETDVLNEMLITRGDEGEEDYDIIGGNNYDNLKDNEGNNYLQAVFCNGGDGQRPNRTGIFSDIDRYAKGGNTNYGNGEPGLQGHDGAVSAKGGIGGGFGKGASYNIIKGYDKKIIIEGKEESITVGNTTSKYKHCPRPRFIPTLSQTKIFSGHCDDYCPLAQNTLFKTLKDDENNTNQKTGNGFLIIHHLGNIEDEIDDENGDPDDDIEP